MDTANTTPPLRILRLKEVQARTGLGRSSIYDRIARGEFPRPVKLGPANGASGWLESEVTAFIASKIAARDANAA